MPNIPFVDENDNIIGTGSIKEAVEKGIIHRISVIFLFNSKGEVLIHRRSFNAHTSPGLWGHSAGGHVDEGESYEQAAYRETQEEIGVTDAKLEEVVKAYRVGKTPQPGLGQPRKRFFMLYRGTYDGPVAPNPEEVAEVRWIDPQGLLAWMERNPEEFVSGLAADLKEVLKYK